MANKESKSFKARKEQGKSTKAKYYYDSLVSAGTDAEIQEEEQLLGKFMFYRGIKAEVDRNKPDNLNQNQAYSLSLVVSSILTEYHEDLVVLKKYAKFCYSQAEPGSTHGEDYFRELNSTRNEIKKVKAKIKNLENIQITLKRIVRY